MEKECTNDDVVDTLLRAPEKDDCFSDFYDRSYCIRYELTKASDRHRGRHEPQTCCFSWVASAISCSVDFYGEVLAWQQKDVATRKEQGNVDAKAKSTRKCKRR